MDILDFQNFTQLFRPMTCIMSVRKLPDGTCGEIRIVTGNKEYIEMTMKYTQLGANIFTEDFLPDQPYTRYIQQDLNFEDFCFRSAVLGKTLNTYVKPERMPFWIHLTMVPLTVPDAEPDLFYCTYSQEISTEADPNMIALQPDIASAVISTCMKLGCTEDFEKTIQEVICDIRDLCDASHCCILLTDFSERTCEVLCEAFSKTTDLLPMKHYLDEDFFEIAESWIDTIGGSTCIIVKDEHDWEVLRERNPRWSESLASAGAKNIVLFPLRNDNEVLGFIWAINYNVENVIKIKETLELTTYFVAAQIANQQMIKRLRVLSTIDLLTGVMNRNSMNNRVEELVSGKDETTQNVGVVFADLNGLKAVNDCEGHFAGDLMLKNAALVLMRCFPDCEIYRAGGDEFSVFAVDLPETELHRRIVLMHETLSSTEGVSFAVGCCTRPAKEVRMAMRLADERMYEDKLMYYKLHPELRRN
ncbi:MAG: sensor domain-containing diguanylate cyclase [Oscillospiraceae bacterium]|nr:sensor domain-containing diguanylate cyclase [Oscillospiraceae bacterium]